jgi:hypothetical protein
MSISIASVSEITDIMSYINSEWKEGHILARDENFFKYEHFNKNQINFVISKDSGGLINGVLGFIPCALGEVTDVCTVIWKVSKSSKNPSLGIQLLQYLKQKNEIRTVLSVGINEKTIGIYQYLGFFTERLKHYVLINKNIKKFKIAKVPYSKYFNNISTSSEDMFLVKFIRNESELLSFQFDNFKKNIPYKNKEYFTKRYFQHPIYKYDLIGVYDSLSLVGIFVIRCQAHNDAKVLRIIDFIGEENTIKSFGKFILEIMAKEGYEYVDFYCFGLDNKTLNNAGFFLVSSDDNLVIPNYFSPFLQKNIQIEFFVDTKDIKFIKLFKGDGDQDRPS